MADLGTVSIQPRKAGPPTAESIGEFVKAQRDQAYSIALRITQSPADAEDAVQDAALRFLSRQGDPPFPPLDKGGKGGVDGCRALFYRAVVQCALDLSRRDARRGQREAAFCRMGGDAMKAQEPASALAERGETLQVLRQAVGELPEEERLPVELCFFEGLSVADTARGLDLPRETARARLRRAMEKLRGFLSSKGHKAGPAMILALLWRDGCQPASASLCARLDSVLPGRPCALIEPVAPQGQVNGKEFLRMGNGALVKAALATVAAVALVAAAWRVNRGAGRVERGTGILPVAHGQDGRATAGSAELGSGTKSGLGTSNTDPRATLSEPLTANPAPSSPNPTPPGDVTASVRQIEARKAEKTAAHSREAASRVEWQQGEIHVLTEPAPGERSVRTIEVAPGAGARR